MQKEIVELAKLFKERDKSDFDTFVIGKVISPPPSTVIQESENVILRNDQLIFSAHLTNGTNTLKAGNSVILIPSSDKQMYVVIDKAVTY